MNIIIGLMLTLQLGVSCRKDVIKPICKPTDTTTNKIFNKDFEVVWENTSETGFTTYGTVVTPTAVVYFYDPLGSGGDNILACDKVTGDTLWLKTAQGSTSKHKLVNNTICYDGRGDLRCIDYNTGQQLWLIDGTGAKQLDGFIHANNRIYASFNSGGIIGDSTKLYEIDPLTGQDTEKFTIYGDDREGYNQSLKDMVYWSHPNGNGVIFVQSVGYKPETTTQRGEYFGIDITGDSMYWDLGSYFNHEAIGCPPILKGNNTIVHGGFKGNASFDLLNKTVNWNYQLANSFGTGRGVMLSLEDKIFQSLGNAANFNIINVNDGSLFKNYNDLGYDNWKANLKKYNDYVYLTSTIGLFKFNSNGEIVKKAYANEWLGENVLGSIQFVDIDPDTGYLYCTVGNSLVCLKEK